MNTVIFEGSSTIAASLPSARHPLTRKQARTKTFNVFSDAKKAYEIKEEIAA